MKKRFGQVKTYDDWLKPYLVSNTLELLDKEIPRLKAKIKSVHLCFTTDPFNGYPQIEKMSLDAIKKLNKAGIKCSVLTKGILPEVLAKCSEILKAVSFVDNIIFGRTNYSKVVSSGYPGHKKFYNEKAAEVKQFCKGRKIKCHIKEKTITKE